MDMAATQTTRFRVEGMDCASCASKIDTAARRHAGVEDVSVSVGAGTMTVSHAANADLRGLLRSVERLGYKIAQINKTGADTQNERDVGQSAPSTRDQHNHVSSGGPWWRSGKALIAIASGLALIAAYGVGKLVPEVSHWAFAVAMLVGLMPIARRAVMAAFAGTPFSIEMLMTIAAVGAVIIGASEEAAAVVFLFLVGELLEGFAAGRARASIQGLADLVPKVALVERNGQTVSIEASKLGLGDIILVRPGDRIPADGDITEGTSEIDEAPVTGESTPKRKALGDKVFAGTISTDGMLRIRATATAEDNTIARIVRLVEEAQESKAPTERFIDRFSKYYTPGVVAVAALVGIVPPVFIGGDWLAWVYKGLAVLLIGCPCALVISTPAAIAAGLSAGARHGLLMKGGAVLEKLRTITAVAFDKTGTLTSGKPVVTDAVSFGPSERKFLSMVAALEAGSSHPLAMAVLDYTKQQNVPVPPVANARAIAGQGIEGTIAGETIFFGSPQAANERVLLSQDQKHEIERLQYDGKTISVLVAGAEIVGAIAIRDEARADAGRGLMLLRTNDIRTVMLTGDSNRTAKAIGDKLGIEARSELMPVDKQRIVSEMQRDGLIVAKVGDGINDAPALAVADIGIAMGGGTDIALETADAAILHSRVTDVWSMIELSKKVMANIEQNIAIAIGLKAVFLVTTVVGLTGLWPAILADTGATVIVTANAMRLLAWKGQAGDVTPL